MVGQTWFDLLSSIASRSEDDDDKLWYTDLVDLRDPLCLRCVGDGGNDSTETSSNTSSFGGLDSLNRVSVSKDDGESRL